MFLVPIRLIFIQCLLLVSYLFSSTAKTENIVFAQLNVNDGLPSNAVRTIAQDQQGYIWIGTELGLARYDGYSIKQYLADGDKPNTIAGSYILSLEVDNSNTLWVSSSKGGLSRYNRDMDDFTVFAHDKNDLNSISSNTIIAIRKQQEHLWIATDKGLDRLNTKTNLFTHFTFQSTNTPPKTKNKIQVLLISNNGLLWVRSDQGLSLFDPLTGRFEVIRLKDGIQPIVRTITESSTGQLWVGTHSGLYAYTPSDESVKKIRFKENVKRVYASSLDLDNNLWIGTSRNGIYRIDQDDNIINFKPDKTNSTSLKDETIFTLRLGQTGEMWLGTYDAGISHFEPKDLLFGSYNNSKNSINCLPSTDIRSSLALNNETFLVGTLKGLSEINLNKKECQNYSFEKKDQNSLSHNEVYAILKKSENEFWIGTSRGLDLFDRATGRFERFGEKIDNATVIDIVEIENYLYLATNKGMYLFDKRKNKFTSVAVSEDGLLNAYIFRMAVDINETLWIASDRGLLKLDNEHSLIHLVEVNGKPVTRQSVLTLNIDIEGMVWLAIEDEGMYKFDPLSLQLQSLEDILGLGMKNGFTGIYFDSLDNLWLATETRGIFKIDKERKKMTNYNISDGLHSELFNFGSFTAFPDGRLLFGGKSGFNLFDPKSVQTNNLPPVVSLSSFRRFGETVVPHLNYDGFKIDNHISELKTIFLSHRDPVFSFGFVAIHYSDPSKITYAYQLQGFDRDWNYTNAQNRGVTYNNVDPGDYIFKVKAKKPNGIWNKEDVELNIVVSPAPWLTWWAFTLYIAMALLAVYFYVKRRTYLLEKRARILQETVEEKISELSDEKNKVEKLLDQKNEEFTTISHEFRTPLTLIIGPISQLIETAKSDLEKNKLNIVHRNGYRLLRMVDQLLNLQTFRIQSIEKRSPQAVGRIVRQLTDAFFDLAKEKNISLTTCGLEEIYFELTPDALEKVILNLLSNAIKYTKAGGSIIVSTTRTPSNEFCLNITDTGVGIQEKDVHLIFERYSRIIDKNSEQITGSGIGLALVKDLVEDHKGRIIVKSQVNKGTTFTIYLPIIGEVDSIKEFYSSNEENISMEIKSLTYQSSKNNLVDGDATQIDESFYVSEEHNRSLNKPTVLIVEDNLDMQSYLVSILSSQYQCITSNDGSEGYDKAKEIIPDIILSDVMMPIVDGYVLAEKLRSHMLTNHIPIIFLTARGDKESRLEGWRRDIDEYLTKPFDTHELLLRLRNILSIRQILANKFSSKQQLGSLFTLSKNYNVYDQQFLEKITSFMNTNYSDPDLSLPLFAKGVAMSERQLQRKLKAVINKNIPEYIRDCRLAKSRELLKQGYAITEIAHQVGFSSQSYFSACFKASFEMSPKNYQHSIKLTNTKIN